MDYMNVDSQFMEETNGGHSVGGVQIRGPRLLQTLMIPEVLNNATQDDDSVRRTAGTETQQGTAAGKENSSSLWLSES